MLLGTLADVAFLLQDFPEHSGKYVRGRALNFYNFEQLPQRGGVPQTKVTYLQELDPKGLIPKFLVNANVVGQLSSLSDMRTTFQKSLEIDRAKRAELVPKIKKLTVKKRATEGEEHTIYS